MENSNRNVPSTSSASATLSKSSTSSLAVNQLIEYSKKFSEVNQLKCENELILEQLTFFQNFSQICNERDPFEKNSSNICTNSILESCFNFNVQVIPSDSSSAAIELTNNLSSGGETINLTVQNKSESFSFHHKFWYFLIDFNEGQQVTMWTLDSTLKPSDNEIFSTKFAPQNEFWPEHIKIHIAFSLQFHGQHYIRVFKAGNISIDVLYLISPVKKSSFPSNNGHRGPPYFTAFDSMLNDDAKKFPTISKFVLNMNCNLDKIFISLFLDDSNTQRGFTSQMQSDCCTKLETSEELIVFVENEKIILSRNAAPDNNIETPADSNNGNTTSLNNTFYTWTIRCFNPALLFSLKIAILRRFLNLDGLKVLSPNDVNCEKLYNAKLKLESTQDAVLGDYLEFYIVVRSISEQVRYSL